MGATARPSHADPGHEPLLRLPGWWRGLGAWSRISMVGLLAAALLAVGLGVFIPRQVERHMLGAQTDSNQQVLEALLASRTLPVEDLASGFEDLDRFVGTAVLRGDYVRVKLWAPDGRILYSDDRRLVGRRFPRSPELVAALAGEPQSELSDLSEPENRLDRQLAERLMEFYLPVEQDGRVVAVWEVYQSLDRFEASLGNVRRAVWVSVGSGLGVLLVFLVSSFGSLLAVIQQRRRVAEERSRENTRLYESLQAARRDERELTRRLVTAHEDERKRIVGEIHDGLGQDLHRVLFGLQGCRSGPEEETREELGRLESIVAGSVARLRRLLQDLRPSTLEDVGLGASLRSLAERVRREEGLRVEVRGDRLISPEPPLPVRVAAFRIAQEALRNAVRHSGSSRAIVEVGRDNGALTLLVRDEGTGLPTDPGAGLGLWLMRERAETLGGTLSVRSGPAGTTVTAVMPLEVDR